MGQGGLLEQFLLEALAQGGLFALRRLVSERLDIEALLSALDRFGEFLE
ncbi:hypothetical protein [Stigmatella aurantiaca]|nr:hypothetical protein [Stigmatella aurantiaca]